MGSVNLETGEEKDHLKCDVDSIDRMVLIGGADNDDDTKMHLFGAKYEDAIVQHAIVDPISSNIDEREHFDLQSADNGLTTICDIGQPLFCKSRSSIIMQCSSNIESKSVLMEIPLDTNQPFRRFIIDCKFTAAMVLTLDERYMVLFGE